MTPSKVLRQTVIPVFAHQVLQSVAHQFLLQSLHQSHLNGLSLVLRLAVGAEPLRQNRSILRRGDERRVTFIRLQYLCNFTRVKTRVITVLRLIYARR